MEWKRNYRTFDVTLALESAYLERKIERDQCFRELVEKCNLLVIFKRKHVRSPQLSEESITTQMMEISSKYLTSADATSLQIGGEGNETLASRVLSERAQKGHGSSIAADSVQGLLKKLRSARRQINEDSQYLLNKCLLLKVIFWYLNSAMCIPIYKCSCSQPKSLRHVALSDKHGSDGERSSYIFFS